MKIAETIEGINIKVGANSTEFTKSMAKVNKEIKATSQNMVALDKELKLDPTNVELLNEKLKLTAKQVKQTAGQQKALREEFDRLSNTSIDNLTKEQATLKKSLQTSKKDVTALSKELKGLELSGATSDEVAVLEKKLASAQGEVTGFTDELKIVAKDLKTLGNDPSLDRLQAKIRNNNISMTKLERAAEATTKQLKKLDDNIEVDVKEAEQDLIDLRKVISKVGKDLASIADEDITVDVRTAKKELQALTKEAKDLERVLDNAEGSTIKIDTKSSIKAVKDLEETTTELKTNLGSVTEGTKDLTSGLSGLASTGATDLMNTFTETLPPATKDIADLATNTIKGAASMAALGPAGMVAGAAIGFVTSAITKNIEKQKDFRAINYELATSLGTVAAGSDDTTKAIRDLSRTLGLDVTDGAQVAADAIRTLNADVSDSETVFKDTVGVMATMNATNMDSTQIFTGVSSATETWNLNLYEQKALMGNLSTLTQKYANKADDLLDTIIEFGPTFAGAGLTIDDTMAIIENGLQNGARNTDEVANAFNELNIKLGDSTGVSNDFDLALQRIYNDSTLTSEGFAKMLENDPSGTWAGLNKQAELYAKNGATNAEVVRDLGFLAGTYGEELLAENANLKALNSTSEKAQEINTALLEVGKKEVEVAQKKFDAGEITNQQLNVTKENYEGLSLAMLLNTDYSGENALQLQTIGENLGLTGEQLTLFTEGQGLLNTALETGNISLLAQGENLGLTQEYLTTYGESLGLTAEDIEIFNTKLAGSSTASQFLTTDTEALRLAQESYFTTLGLGSEVQDTFSVKTNGVNRATTVTSSSMVGYSQTVENLTIAQILAMQSTLDQKNALEQVYTQMGFTADEAKVLADNYATLNDKSATAETRTNALSGYIGALEGSQVSAGDATDLLASSMDDLEFSSAELEKITGGLASKQDETTTSTEEGKNAYEQMYNALLKANPKLEKQAENLGKVSTKADAATTSISDYNKEDIDDKTATVTITVNEVVGTRVQPTTSPAVPPAPSRGFSSSVPSYDRMGALSNPMMSLGAGGISSLSSNSAQRLDFNVTVSGLTDNDSKVASELATELTPLLAQQLPKYWKERS